MDKPIDLPIHDEDLYDETSTDDSCDECCYCHEGYRKYYDEALQILATGIDETNEEVSDIKRDIRDIRHEMMDDFEENFALRESVDSQCRETAQLRLAVTRAAACTVALLGAVAIASAVLCKRR